MASDKSEHSTIVDAVDLLSKLSVIIILSISSGLENKSIVGLIFQRRDFSAGAGSKRTPKSIGAGNADIIVGQADRVGS